MPTPKRSTRTIPLQTCSACGSTWFREVTFHRWTSAQTSSPLSVMPQTMLVCLCGTPVAPKWGGVRAGHTPNAGVVRFVASLEQAQIASANPQREAVKQKVVDLCAPRQQIQALNSALKKAEKTLGQLQAGNTPERISRGRTWRLSERPADNGRDYLVRALQDRGFEFREARDAVNAIFECMVRFLKRGEEVEVPWGMSRVVAAPAPKMRIRLRKIVRLNRHRRKVKFVPGEAFR